MSARDLVGRPLVPFFDAQDNVNESLELNEHATQHEQLDVDARVWDKALGYFVYPSEATSSPQPPQHQPQHQHSMPVMIQKTKTATANGSADSGSLSKQLLTPDMLSRSAPSASGSGMQQLHNTMGMTHHVDHPPVVLESDSRVSTPRSASTKSSSSRQKKRSSTPTRTKQRNATPNSTSDGGSSGGDDRTSTSDSSDKPSKNKKNGTRKTRSKQQQQTPQKTTELSGNGKWAWSAFQSSPDPKSLPLPSFAAGGGSSPGLGAMAPPLDPPKVEERLDPPTPPPYPPQQPPGLPADAMHPSSIEHSMTQDLRRMLNIGS